MLNMRNYAARLLLATWMFACAGMASAAPIYRISIDTAPLGSGPAYLGLSFLSLAGAPEASATVSGLAGALLGTPSTTGTVGGGLPGPLVFSNAGGGSDLVQAVSLGGVFSFDVSFAMAPGTTGTTFGWALFGDSGYLGAEGDLGSIFLQPDAPPGQQLSFALASPLAELAVIPEPSSVLLMAMAALALTAALRRQRSRNCLSDGA